MAGRSRSLPFLSDSPFGLLPRFAVYEDDENIILTATNINDQWPLGTNVGTRLFS